MKSFKRDTRAVFSNNPTSLLISEILKTARKKNQKRRTI
tara:strand:+ start:254 stop:370 length:117 start_codon:yes stop_codon:yes gene_type:complete